MSATRTGCGSRLFVISMSAGADPKGRSGQMSPNATHLIKSPAKSFLARGRTSNIFGDDYPTPDGTCVRDYIHVTDLISAHLLVLDAMTEGKTAASSIAATAVAVSVLEVVKAIEDVTESRSPRVGRRDARDTSASLVADATALMQRFGWKPAHADLRYIVDSALTVGKEHSAESLSRPPSRAERISIARFGVQIPGNSCTRRNPRASRSREAFLEDGNLRRSHQVTPRNPKWDRPPLTATPDRIRMRKGRPIGRPHPSWSSFAN